MASTVSGSASPRPLGDGADELLEVEGVAVGAARRCASTVVGGDARRRAPRGRAARAARCGQRRRGGARAGRARPRGAGRARGPRAARAPAPAAARSPSVAQRGVEELDAGQVAPVQVLEDEHERVRRRRSAREPVLARRGASGRPCSTGPGARGARAGRWPSSGNGAPTSSPRNSATRSRSAPATWRATARAQLAAALRERLAVADAGGAAQRLGEQAERRAGAHRVAARRSRPRGRRRGRATRPQSSCAQARLADAGRRR